MKTILLTFAGLLFGLTAIAQSSEKKSVVIGAMTNKNNAILIVNPPNADQGVLLPQLSTIQRLALKPDSPSENGLTVFDMNIKSFFYWTDGAWVSVPSGNSITTGFYAIDPIDFQMLKPNYKVDGNNLVVFESDNTFVTPSRNNDGEEAMAAINLPHHAIIKEVTVYYMDNDQENLRIRLMRKTLAGENQTILTWESVGLSSEIRQQSFSYFNGQELIDLENYTYRFSVTFDIDDENVGEPALAKQRIYGVKIKYQQ